MLVPNLVPGLVLGLGGLLRLGLGRSRWVLWLFLGLGLSDVVVVEWPLWSRVACCHYGGLESPAGSPGVSEATGGVPFGLGFGCVLCSLARALGSNKLPQS